MLSLPPPLIMLVVCGSGTYCWIESRRTRDDELGGLLSLSTHTTSVLKRGKWHFFLFPFPCCCCSPLLPPRYIFCHLCLYEVPYQVTLYLLKSLLIIPGFLLFLNMTINLYRTLRPHRNPVVSCLCQRHTGRSCCICHVVLHCEHLGMAQTKERLAKKYFGLE